MKQQNFKQNEYRQDKKEFIEALPTLLQNNSHEYDIYFVTFTFQNTFRDYPHAHFQNFFDKLRSKIDQFVLSHPDVRKVRPALILFPETSNQPVQQKMYTNPHFHGFLLIHKDTREKFERKAIARIMTKETSSGTKQVIHLCDRVINPFLPLSKNLTSSNVQNNARPALCVYSHELYLIKNVSEFFATSYYSSKCYLSRDFSYDDVIISSKMIPPP